MKEPTETSLNREMRGTSKGWLILSNSVVTNAKWSSKQKGICKVKKKVTHVPTTKEPDACLALKGKMKRVHADIVIQEVWRGASKTKLKDAKNQTVNSSMQKLVWRAIQLHGLWIKVSIKVTKIWAQTITWLFLGQREVFQLLDKYFQQKMNQDPNNNAKGKGFYQGKNY